MAYKLTDVNKPGVLFVSFRLTDKIVWIVIDTTITTLPLYLIHAFTEMTQR